MAVSSQVISICVKTFQHIDGAHAWQCSTHVWQLDPSGCSSPSAYLGLPCLGYKWACMVPIPMHILANCTSVQMAVTGPVHEIVQLNLWKFESVDLFIFETWIKMVENNFLYHQIWIRFRGRNGPHGASSHSLSFIIFILFLFFSVFSIFIDFSFYLTFNCPPISLSSFLLTPFVFLCLCFFLQLYI